ncbi:TlpA disulfide reductase family protein [Lutibacter sp.]|uniref:TlpA family protein disulfide reductase n=1 Tax=Lutibacter sp. TaxID=1925666 RepID=UPI0025C28FDC|nr:TlpA disulfide reductase family protein [Lutibacter sp.]MCF6169319.1 TlpA family protein disulfide reductase [Lutibacter sp.]
MKKIIWLIVALPLLIISCENNNKVEDYVTIKGKLKSGDIEKITIQGRGYSKDIEVDSNGTFSDTLKITNGVFAMVNGNDRITLFLKNGYNLNLEFKGDKFSDGIVYTGKGAVTNNFMEDKRSFYMSDLANPKTYFKLDKEAYKAKVAEAKSILKGFKDKAKNLDSIIDKADARNDKMFFGYIDSNYEKMHSNMVKFAKGKVSPVFKNYENSKGGTTSLKDLRGKYVYLDIWATWCAPCKAEIPYLKALEKEFRGKNIEFVSISVDKPNAHKTWKEMVKNEELGGIQLFADNNFESEFIVEYGINSIPRFILLDPEGNIVDADAVRPSNPRLKELLKELGI